MMNETNPMLKNGHHSEMNDYIAKVMKSFGIASIKLLILEWKNLSPLLLWLLS
jgi:hypothetical protein